MKPFIFKIVVLSSLFTSACIFEGPFMMREDYFRGEKDSCGFMVDEYSGQGLRWKKSKFPVIFKIHTNVPPEARKNFISAVDHWNLAWHDFLETKELDPFDLFYVDLRGVYEGDTGADGNNLFLFANENFSRYMGKGETQAVTIVRADRITPSIIDTDILVNNKNFKFYYDSAYNTAIDLVKQNFEKKRYLASLKNTGRFFQIMKKLKTFFSVFLKPFKKPKQIRKIADYKPDIPKNKVDFPSLIVHELGHVPGRSHFDESESYAYFSKYSQNDSRSRNRKNKASLKSKVDNSKHISVMEPLLQQGRARREIAKYDLEKLFCAYYNY